MMAYEKWLGSKERPCMDNADITIAMRGRTDCMLYTMRTSEIAERNLIEANARNITFVGLNVGRMKGERQC